MIRKMRIVPIVLMGLYGIAHGSSQPSAPGPMANGSTVYVDGKILNSLAFVSSDSQTTNFDQEIAAYIEMFGISLQAWFNAGNPVMFSVSSGDPYGTGTVYSLQMMRSNGGGMDYGPSWDLQGSPAFEIVYNGLSTGCYFGGVEGEDQFTFTLAPISTYPAINVAANLAPTAQNVDLYRVPALGNYFAEITSMSFTDVAGQSYPVGSAQIAALNAQYQRMPQGESMSIRVKNNSFVALFAGQSPYVLLPNVASLGFPLTVYVNNVLVATVGSPLAQANPNGPLLCALQK